MPLHNYVFITDIAAAILIITKTVRAGRSFCARVKKQNYSWCCCTGGAVLCISPVSKNPSQIPAIASAQLSVQLCPVATSPDVSRRKHILAPCGCCCHQAIGEGWGRLSGKDGKNVHKASLVQIHFSVLISHHVEKKTTRANYCSVFRFQHRLGSFINYLEHGYIFIRILCHNMSWHIIHFFPLFPAHCQAIKNKSQTTVPTYIQGGNGETGARLPHVILVICSH